MYAFDDTDHVLGELTAGHPDVEDITWTVTLANGKAQWWQFAGTAQVAAIANGDSSAARRRNADLQGDTRDGLVVGPARASVGGSRQRSGPLDGTFLTWPNRIYLGEARTDEAGRLLVLGGHGQSASILPDNPLNHYANNDRWFDDTSDGPISATVTLSGSRIDVY